jgi:hypothetical protein
MTVDCTRNFCFTVITGVSVWTVTSVTGEVNGVFTGSTVLTREDRARDKRFAIITGKFWRASTSKTGHIDAVLTCSVVARVSVDCTRDFSFAIIAGMC